MFHQGCEPQKELELFVQRDKTKGDFFEIGFDSKQGRFLKVNEYVPGISTLGQFRALLYVSW